MRPLSLVAPLLALWACRQDVPRQVLPPPLGAADLDHDGVKAIAAGGTDCDDLDARVSPEATERCNGRDDDCDQVLDEGFGCVAGAERACGRDVGMVERCSGDCAWGACTPSVPVPGCPPDSDECDPGAEEPCRTACGNGERTCTAACTWTPCTPPDEVCNGADDDCDGSIDEDAWGLASPLRPLQWTGGTADDVAVFTSSGIVSIAHVANDYTAAAQVIVSWLDPSGQSAAEPALVQEGVRTVIDLDATPLDADVAVAWSDFEALRVAVVSTDGVTATWEAGWFSKAELFWTGSELGAVVFPRMQLLRFDRGGLPVSDPVDFPSHFMSHVAWSGDSVVLPDLGGVLWVGLDGVVQYDLRLDDPETRPAVAAVPGGIAIAYPREGGDLVFLVADGAGGEVTNATAPAPPRLRSEQLLLAPPLATAEGFLIASSSKGLNAGHDFVGWVVDATGRTVSRPDYWLTAPDLWSFPSWSVTSDGNSALLVLSADGLAVASLGCRSAP